MTAGAAAEPSYYLAESKKGLALSSSFLDFLFYNSLLLHRESVSGKRVLRSTCTERGRGARKEKDLPSSSKKEENTNKENVRKLPLFSLLMKLDPHVASLITATPDIRTRIRAVQF